MTDANHGPIGNPSSDEDLDDRQLRDVAGGRPMVPEPKKASAKGPPPPIPGIESVTNPKPTKRAAKAESDAQLRRRRRRPLEK